jgi:hypothetical protein
MFGFFRRKKHVSLSPEVQLLWAELEKFRVRCRGRVEDERTIDAVANEISTVLTVQGNFATDLILKRGWSPADAANMMIAEYVSAEILSGKLHIYRGMLSDKGRSYLRLFKVCTEKMIKSGRMQAQQGYAGIREFEQEIAALG